jgi:hypothetical protein
MAGQWRTSADLINETLARLGVQSTGQPTDPEDFNYVLGLLDSLMRKLNALEIVSIPDVNNIPGIYFNDLADIVAGEACTKFGSTPDDVIKLKMSGLGGIGQTPVGGGAAAMSLKQMNRGRYTGETLQVQYF